MKQLYGIIWQPNQFGSDFVANDTLSANDFSHVEPAGHLDHHQAVPCGLPHIGVKELAWQTSI